MKFENLIQGEGGRMTTLAYHFVSKTLRECCDRLVERL